MEPTIIYTSDWHLGKRQYGLKHREQDRYKAAWHVLKKAVQTGAVAVLNGGDILDVTRPTSRAVNELRKMHKYLRENGLPMYLVQGNHDKTSPPWFDLFLEDEPKQTSGLVLLEQEKVNIPGTGLSVYGVPEMPVDKLVEHLESDEAPCANILLTHVMVRDWIGFKSPSALELKDLPDGKYQQAVIGDVHKTEMCRIGKTMCISPGSIELGARDEQVTKYYIQVDVKTLKLESKTIPTRPVVFVQILNEDEMKEGMDAISNADAVEALIYLTYDPSIDGIVNRVMSKKTKPGTIIDMKTEVSEEQLHDGDFESDSDELRSFASFAPEFTEDDAVISAFNKVISTDNAMDDIVEELVADLAK